MVQRSIISSALKLDFGKTNGSYSISKIAHEASADNYLKLAKAINSLQTKTAEKYIKTSKYELTFS